MGAAAEWSRMLEGIFEGMFFEARLVFDGEMLEKIWENSAFGLGDEAAPEEVAARWIEAFERMESRMKRAEDGGNAEDFYAYGAKTEQWERQAEKEALIKDVPEKDEKLISVQTGLARDIGERNAQEMLFESFNKMREHDEEQGIIKKGGRAEKVRRILESGTEKNDQGAQRIKVEMTEPKRGYGFDFDETVDMLTERLCALMAKGSDGLYL